MYVQLVQKTADKIKCISRDWSLCPRSSVITRASQLSLLFCLALYINTGKWQRSPNSQRKARRSWSLVPWVINEDKGKKVRFVLGVYASSLLDKLRFNCRLAVYVLEVVKFSYSSAAGLATLRSVYIDHNKPILRTKGLTFKSKRHLSISGTEIAAAASGLFLAFCMLIHKQWLIWHKTRSTYKLTKPLLAVVELDVFYSAS